MGQITAQTSLDLGMFFGNQHTGVTSNNCVSIAYNKIKEGWDGVKRSDLSDDFLQSNSFIYM